MSKLRLLHRREDAIAWALTGPAMLLMAVFVIAPMVLALSLTVFDYDPFTQTLRFVGLRNFERMLPSTELWQATANTLIYTVITVPLTVVGGLMVALLIHGVSRGAGIWRSAYFLPVAATLTASGLTFPHTRTAEDAVAAVRTVKFAPEGDRTLTSPAGHGMHARWSLGLDLEDAFEFANRETLVICLIEDPVGLANVSDIAAVPGVDVVTFGPNDISASLGHTGNTMHPEVRSSVREGIVRVRAESKAAGISVGSRSTEWAADYVEAGVRVLQFLPAPLLIDAVERTRSDLGI